VTRWALGALVLLGLVLGLAAVPSAQRPDPTVTDSTAIESPRFQAVDVYLDSESPVAAYQLEVRVVAGDATIVGVEGGTPPLDAPPYYDPAALAGGRIILAAFDTAATLPPGHQRIATVHFREQGPPATYHVELTTAGDGDGQRRDATASIEARKGTP